MRLGIILFVILFLPAIVFADTLTVPGDYPAIQDAIDAARSGDVILVDPGNYQENIDFLGKDIIVQSTGGLNVTIINGGQVGSVVTFADGEPGTAVLDGFELTNGFAADGGGVFCAADSSPVIMNCRVRFNEAVYYGGGIYVNGSSPMILDTYVDNNIAWNGAGISCYESSPEIQRCHIFKNDALGLGGGGIYCYNESNLKIVNTVIHSNEGSSGAGILCGLSVPEVTNCVIANNIASYSGGGLCLYHYSTMFVWNSIIFFNEAPLEAHISRIDESLALVFYSDVEGAWPGIGNIKANPRFVNENGGDYHLLEISACIDKGSDQAPNLPETDYEGDPRVIDGRDVKTVLPKVDMGADELWYFSADNDSIASQQGGTVNFELDARSDYANRSYVILGGVSGYSPGWNFGKAVLPVNRDPVTDFILANLSSPLLVDFVGTLNAQGKADAQLNMPPLNPGIGNFTLYLAYLLMSPYDYASNHVEIDFYE